MQFIRSSDWYPATKIITERLTDELIQGKKVLWLISGGSNIIASVNIMQQLPAPLTRNLTIMMMDERYGSLGHENSNEAQLLNAGFDFKQATMLHILSVSSSLYAAKKRYEQLTKQAIAASEIIIAQLGMGADGHIAGILPDSAAINSPDFVAAYDSPPFTRLTLTPHALKHVSVGYLLAFGDAKKPALQLLSQKLVPYAVQPAQLLKELPECYVFNDQIGDS